ncbi:protein translocase subunit SecD [Tomitella fengzijianii]|uniref:Protein translocase subunit SecD n=1 Tax=Tomitella fengzijianii TaxID=2597660 RepID=A0A516X3B1_9ACTN|nr:protein translocase subunit SecD [Tomitella fengzijianii]QDQ97562.1 protein translocase subunit SecD [Tomitella fengzijianii]
MAKKSGQFHPARYLALFGVIVAVLYALVFFTGDREPTPQLGIDLQGGTSVTLTARTPDGSSPSDESLDQARKIIESRVNGLGVSGASVVVDGDNIVITVPGSDGEAAKSLGQTAKLTVRPVLQSQPMGAAAGAPQAPAPAPSAPEPGASGGAPDTDGAPAPQNRVYPLAAPGDAPAPGEDAPAAPTPAPAGGEPATAPGTTAPSPAEAAMTDQARAEIEAAKKTRQSTDPAVQQQSMSSLAATGCSGEDPLRGNDDPALPLVACNADGQEVMLLGPAIIKGEQISNAQSQFDQQQGGYIVSLEFKPDASQVWADFTRENLQKRAAFVLDTEVISAPVIEGVTPAGSATSIFGDFSQTEAQSLANQLKYGSLPLSFSQSDAKTVSATLGLSSLQAGLIAGLVGLILVLLYCLAYYRVLGVLISLSLILSGVLVYALLVLLGRSIGYSLDLAGIAGLIIGIGTTADSFVVYFERVKDEIREGRSFRSAVPRGWARARRTILSGNTVSIIGAAVLYFLAIGDVKGFAFTLGLTTILDLVVVFLVTHPLLHIASTKQWAANPRWNGLGAMSAVARERKAAALAAAAKES